MSFGYLYVISAFEFSQTQWMFYTFNKIKNLIQEKKSKLETIVDMPH